MNQADADMTATKEEVFGTHGSRGIGGMTFHEGPRGEADGGRRNSGKSLDGGFYGRNRGGG